MYTIGRLARRARVNVDTIRFYERQSLLSAATKTDSGYRLYTDQALRRINFIKHAQRCGFSLAEIGELLQMHEGDQSSRREAYALAARKQAEIQQTIAALEDMKNALASLVADRATHPLQTRSSDAESPLLDALDACRSGEHGTSRSGRAPVTPKTLLAA